MHAHTHTHTYTHKQAHAHSLLTQLPTNTSHMHTAPDQQLSDNRLEQVHHRLVSFDTEWPQLKRWMLRSGSIININANEDIGKS